MYLEYVCIIMLVPNKPFDIYTGECMLQRGFRVYGAKAADLYDPCVAPEMSDWRPPQAYM